MCADDSKDVRIRQPRHCRDRRPFFCRCDLTAELVAQAVVAAGVTATERTRGSVNHIIGESVGLVVVAAFGRRV